MKWPSVGIVLIAACGDPDPCAEVAGACLVVEVTSSTVDRIDQLELDIVYGDFHGTTTTQPAGGRVVTVPLSTAIAIEVAAADSLAVGVVAAGKLGGVVLGTGAASANLGAGAHETVVIELAPIAECVAGGLYCGGDKLAGDPETLYQCNGGGVPRARGACASGCIVRPTADDTCRASAGTCVDGGLYCGGDKLDGDPQTLYRCSANVGIAGVVCADGCIVAAAGTDDRCR